MHEQNFTNDLKLVPSRSAVPMLLRHAGFGKVFWVPDSTNNRDYQLGGGRGTFIAYK